MPDFSMTPRSRFSWPGSGPQQAVAAHDLEIEVRERFGRVALVLDGEGEPEAEHGDVDGELVVVDAVEVAPDDVELEFVEAARVDSDVVEGGLKLDEFLHHAEQVGARSARGIDDGHLVQRLGDLRRRP